VRQGKEGRGEEGRRGEGREETAGEEMDAECPRPFQTLEYATGSAPGPAPLFTLAAHAPRSS